MKKIDFKRIILRVLFIAVTAFLFYRYVALNWDNIKHFIFNLF